MEIAFTCANGDNEGEMLRELNPKYQQKRKALEKQLEKARR